MNFLKASWNVWILSCVLTLSTFFQCGTTFSSDDSPEAQSSSQRMKLMKDATSQFQINSKRITNRSSLQFKQAPLLRYSDATRRLYDAGVWRLGATGRPTAFVTLELYNLKETDPFLSYEFTSLSTDEFSMASPLGAKWEATGTDLKMLKLPNAPKPAAKTRTRRLQMKQLIKRFFVREENFGKKTQCRLMPQPIDRYQAPKDGILEGAVFAFAIGTNPELALVLECDQTRWSYGMVRLSAAALFATLDKVPAQSFPKLNQFPLSANYTSASHSITLSK